MANADKYHILVSGLAGSVYIAKLTKTPHLMSSDRRKVPESEFINAVLEYTKGKLAKGSDTLQITEENGTVLAEIKITDSKLLKAK